MICILVDYTGKACIIATLGCLAGYTGYYNSYHTKQGHAYPGWFPDLVETYRYRDLHGDAVPAADI